MDGYRTVKSDVTLGTSPGSRNLWALESATQTVASVSVSDTQYEAVAGIAASCVSVYGCVRQNDSIGLGMTFTSCTRRPLWLDLQAPSTSGVLVSARSYSQVPNLTSSLTSRSRDLFPLGGTRGCFGNDCNANSSSTVALQVGSEGRFTLVWTPFKDDCAELSGIPLTYTIEMEAAGDGTALTTSVAHLGFFPHLQVSRTGVGRL
jgi:hypothetical protein